MEAITKSDLICANHTFSFRSDNLLLQNMFQTLGKPLRCWSQRYFLAHKLPFNSALVPGIVVAKSGNLLLYLAHGPVFPETFDICVPNQLQSFCWLIWVGFSISYVFHLTCKWDAGCLSIQTGSFFECMDSKIIDKVFLKNSSSCSVSFPNSLGSTVPWHPHKTNYLGDTEQKVRTVESFNQ